jgi:RNA polymerase sigma-70 factor (ECF subfamily)
VALEQELVLDVDNSSRMLGQDLAAALTSPSLQAARREQSVLLADALARLPEDYREVIILRHLEELPFAEVARRMQRSEDSVQKLWLRGLAQLRTTFSAGE